MARRLLTIIGLLALAVPTVALAHAVPRGAPTVSGDEVAIALSSPAESRYATADGGTVRVDPADPYLLIVRSERPTVRVKLLSRDGHVTVVTLGGAGRPTVDAVAERDGWAQIVGRLVVLVALAVLTGGAAVARWVVLAGARAPIVAFDHGVRAVDHGPVPSLAGARRAARPLALAGLVGVALLVGGLAWSLRTGDVAGLLIHTRTGHTALVTAFALIVAAVALGPTIGIDDARIPVAAAAGAVGFAALAIGGHATSSSDAILGGVFDTAHGLATAVWIGGLAVLLAAGRSLDTGHGGASIGSLAAVVVRFSSVAVACVAVLVVSGIYRALAEVSSLGDLVSTPYGRVLTLKLVVFSVMMFVGGYNRLVLHPRLERAALGLHPDDRGASRRLWISIRAELVLATLVLALVAVLMAFPPPA